MKFQRRILPPHSSSYFEMEEYLTPSLSRPSSKCFRPLNVSFVIDHLLDSVTGSSSDLSEIESVCSVSTPFRQKSDSLTNLFHLSEDNTSVSNLSLASYSPSQHSADCNSPATFTSLSTQSTFYGQGSDKSSRTRRSMCSLNSNSQKSFSIKTADTALSTMATHPSSSDKCGLIANDGNDLDDHGQASDEEDKCLW